MFAIFYKGLNKPNLYSPNANIKSIPEFNSETLIKKKSLNSKDIFNKNNFYLLNKLINEIPFDRFSVDVQHLRRPNMLEDIEARFDIRLNEGDIIVILGLPRDLIEFEKFTITGV